MTLAEKLAETERALRFARRDRDALERKRDNAEKAYNEARELYTKALSEHNKLRAQASRIYDEYMERGSDAEYKPSAQSLPNFGLPEDLFR